MSYNCNRRTINPRMLMMMMMMMMMKNNVSVKQLFEVLSTCAKTLCQP